MSNRLLSVPLLSKPLLWVYRANIAGRHVIKVGWQAIIWLLKSREVTNFTYDLDHLNKQQLAAAVAFITGQTYYQVMGYFTEIESDVRLIEHIQSVTRACDKSGVADLDVKFGRRIVWYAFTRAIRPRIVIETGVDKGLGSCVITSALLRNRQEGAAGYYYGTDINPHAGYLLCGEYATVGEILYGDSIASLSTFRQPIDLFIGDSDHSAHYEAKEYRVISEKLSPDAILISDNAHETDELLKFALDTGRYFLFVSEKPHRHWYPGAGLGIAFMRQLPTSCE